MNAAERFTRDKIQILCRHARNPQTICTALGLPFAFGARNVFLKTPKLADPYRHWLPTVSFPNWRAIWRALLLEHAAEIANTLPVDASGIPVEPLDGVS